MYLLSLTQNANSMLWVYIMCFARILGTMLIFPIFNSAYINKTLKTLLALLFASIITPYELQQISLVDNLFVNLSLVVKEFILGAGLSYLLSFPFWMIENCGNLIDIQRGEQFGANFDPTMQHPSSSIAKLILRAFIVYFIGMNGLLFFTEFIFNSFQLIPIDKFIPTLPIMNHNYYISFFTNYFKQMVMLSLPVIFTMFIFEIILGLISSFIPQLNVTILAMPIKSAIALLFLTFYLAYILHQGINQYALHYSW